MYRRKNAKTQKAPKRHQSRPHDCVYSSLRANAAPILQRFFSHPIFRAKLKKLYLAICPWSQLFRALWFVDRSKPYHGFCQSCGGSHFHMDILKDQAPSTRIGRCAELWLLFFEVQWAANCWRCVSIPLVYLTPLALCRICPSCTYVSLKPSAIFLFV